MSVEDSTINVEKACKVTKATLDQLIPNLELRLVGIALKSAVAGGSFVLAMLDNAYNNKTSWGTISTIAFGYLAYRSICKVLDYKIFD